MNQTPQPLLLDSNIVIYASKPTHQFLYNWMVSRSLVVSAISRVEVLGFHNLTSQERQFLEALFATVTVLPLLPDVVERAIQLRQQKKTSLGDALVAATALEHNLPLVSRNKSDFVWMSGLQVFDPFDPADFQKIV
jgi:toxin FitB